jgi:SAM-dependent methyltransferase
MSDFYKAFEDRYRGSRETVKERLRVYLPFLAALRRRGAEGRVLDLGCGRGEWLELLRETGVAAAGVDVDEGMLASCREAGLAVHAGDLLSNLRECAAESLDVVSAFHVVEHLPFSRLQAVVQEALRVLRPGGLLVMETPNPENLSVGAAGFYLDPTHVRPLHPGLLAFVPEHYGFARVKILRLQEPSALAQGAVPTLLNVLRDVSPDYAVVAEKGGAPADPDLDSLFAREYGFSLEGLAARYDSAIETRLRQAEARVQEAVAHAQQLRQSRSWRWSAPLRWLMDAVNRSR